MKSIQKNMRVMNYLCIFVIGVLIIYIITHLLPLYIKPSIETYEMNDMKILHLVLYSESEYYTQMYKITSDYYQKYTPSIQTIYYCYRSNLEEPYLLQDDILYIKGEESYIPGILEKTIKTLEYYQHEFMNFDYIIRSNISTIINFDLLIPKLKSNPLEYGGGIIFDMTPEDGSEPYYFISGTSIIMSPSFATALVQQKDKIDNTEVDDVAIGKFFSYHYYKKERPPSLTDDDKSFVFIDDTKGDYEKIREQVNPDITIFYRNRITNEKERSVDVKQMQFIKEKILNSSPGQSP